LNTLFPAVTVETVASTAIFPVDAKMNVTLLIAVEVSFIWDESAAVVKLIFG